MSNSKEPGEPGLSAAGETLPGEGGAWRRSGGQPSLTEAFRTVRVPGASASFWRKFLAFSGPGYLVAVGYMDPGNWATSLAGGSAFGS